MGNIADIVYKLMILTAKIAVISVSIISFTILLSLITSALLIGLNFGVVNDLIALVQMWLPFNLTVVLVWLITVAFAYIAYRVSVVAVNYMNAWLNT